MTILRPVMADRRKLYLLSSKSHDISSTDGVVNATETPNVGTDPTGAITSVMTVRSPAPANGYSWGMYVGFRASTGPGSLLVGKKVRLYWYIRMLNGQADLHRPVQYIQNDGQLSTTIGNGMILKSAWQRFIVGDTTITQGHAGNKFRFPVPANAGWAVEYSAPWVEILS